MTNEGKIIKYTIISLLAYLFAYVLSASILMSILRGVSAIELIVLMFTAFPSMFTGNIFPSLMGYGAIYLCRRATNEEPVIKTKLHLITVLIIIGIEVIGTIVYYATIGNFVGASFAIITFLIIDVVKTHKEYKKLINPPEAVEVVADDNNEKNDSATTEEPQEKIAAIQDTTNQISYKDKIKSLLTNRKKLLLITAGSAILSLILLVLVEMDYAFEKAFEEIAVILLIWTIFIGCVYLVNISITVIAPWIKKKYTTSPNIKNSNNKFCKYCGAEIDKDSVFCARCGKNITNGR